MSTKSIIFGAFALILVASGLGAILYYWWPGRRGGGFEGATPPLNNKPLIEGKILIQDFRFQPARYVLKKGDKVTWKNLDNVSHTVTAPALGGQHVLPPGAEFTFSTDELPFAGEISYQCDFHPGMGGVLAVLREKPLSSFGAFFEGLSKEKKECLTKAFGSRLQGFLDGTITNQTQEEQKALSECLR